MLPTTTPTLPGRGPIGPGGPDLSPIVYGTWRIFDDPATATPGHLRDRLHACLAAGITTIDTAEIYGGYAVEELLGQALAGAPALRDRLEIVSKSGIYVPHERHPDRRVAHYNASAARIIKSAEKSLRLLGTDHIDVFLVHRPDWLAAADDTAEALTRLLRDGKIRSAGVSNYNVHQFDLLNARMMGAGHALCTNQIEFSLFEMGPIDDGTLDQAQKIHARPMAWSPLGGGRLFRDDDATGTRLRAMMAQLGPRHGNATPEQLAYAWLLAHPSRPMVVIGTNKIERIAAAARATDIQLHREDWYLLWQAARGRRVP